MGLELAIIGSFRGEEIRCFVWGEVRLRALGEAGFYLLNFLPPGDDADVAEGEQADCSADRDVERLAIWAEQVDLMAQEMLCRACTEREGVCHVQSVFKVKKPCSLNFEKLGRTGIHFRACLGFLRTENQ